MFKFFFYKFGQFCVHRLPLQLAYKIAVFISDLQYYFSPRDRKAVTNNLIVILSTNDDVSSRVKEVFRNFGRYLLEFFRMAKFLNKDYIKKNVKIENLHYLDDILKKGKGGIILTAHIGNWELGGVIMSMLGYPIVAVALPHKERPVNDLFNSQREARGVAVVQTNGAIKKCIEALRQNKMVGLLADRDFGLTGEVMDFLGKKALIPKGPASFSEKTGAPILPTFLIREKEDLFTLTIEEPIYPPKEGTEREILLAIMKKYTSIIESKIREYPTQWLMFRKFWIE